MFWKKVFIGLFLLNLSLAKNISVNQLAFLNNIRLFNKNHNDPKYFCSTNSVIKPDFWILRNKKCYNFSDQILSYGDAFNSCKSNPYSYTYLIHRNELQYLQDNHKNELVGVDFFQIYSKLLENIPKKTNFTQSRMNTTISAYAIKPKIEFSIWLNDNFYNRYSDFECDKAKGYVALVKFDKLKCRNGCFSCVSKNSKSNLAYFVCVKSCEWKVSAESFCNTQNLSNYFIENNLYFQADQQSYVCQGKIIYSFILDFLYIFLCVVHEAS
jgi:hypothetical protein